MKFHMKGFCHRWITYLAMNFTRRVLIKSFSFLSSTNQINTCIIGGDGEWR